ncbi:MAG: extracellular solute-binding protein [Cyanobacteria bacterium P01_D01_bin.2]
MVKRRTILWGLLGATVAGCHPQASDLLRIKLLARSIPPQVLKAFERQNPTHFDAELNLVDIYQQLQRWQTHAQPELPLWQQWRQLIPLGDDTSSADVHTVGTNLVTLGDPWLESAVQQQLIQPLSAFSPVEAMPETWQRLLRRDAQGQSTPTGDLWAVPYRTQGMMIAYQKAMFKSNTKPLTKWADLWRPELAGRIAMPNHPRLVAAVVLKVLEHSVNDEAALAEDDFKKQFLALYRQVRVFDSQSYLKALVNEDVWLAVGWSGDILATLTRYRRLGAVYPQEGTALTSDLWVAPTDAKLTKAAQAWMEFCWQTPIATQISLSSHGVSPLFFLPDVDVPELLNQQTLLTPDYGEVLLPLSSGGREILAELLNAIARE